MRCATCASSTSATASGSRTAPDDDAGVRHDRRRASTTTASPRCTRRSSPTLVEQGAEARRRARCRRSTTRQSTGAERDRAAGARRATSPRSPRRCAATTRGPTRRRRSRASGSSCARRERCSRQALRAPREAATRRTPSAEQLDGDSARATLDALSTSATRSSTRRAKKLLDMWPQTKAAYAGDEYVVKIRDKEIRTALTTTSLSGTKVRKVALPRYEDDGEILRWQLRENVPGSFPFTAGVFAFKRENEDPTRMFAGEGDAFRTNKRFHLLADGMPAKRLSTAFDSVTLYGNDPDRAARHLRQGRQLGRVDRDARRHEGAVLGLRPLRAEQLGVDDDQRPGADDPRDVHEHRDRPAARQVPRGQRPRADRRRGRRRSARGRCRRCAAPCRPTS